MRKVERLVNLVALLLDTHRPLTLDQVAELVPGYEATGESLRRMFERDKEELRGLGVPVQAGPRPRRGTGRAARQPGRGQPAAGDADRRGHPAQADRVHLSAAGPLAVPAAGGPVRPGPPARHLVRGRARQLPRRAWRSCAAPSPTARRARTAA